MKRLLTLLCLASLLPACAPLTALFSGSTATPWWREAVFYEIFVRSFSDSDGDGIGDLNGVTQKLDYLQNLGVTALWLMPLYPSPSYHGYDVLNYYNVNPQYGTLEDFKRLVSEAHGRKMRVIIDFVPNHTSSAHPFFQAARDPQSPYRDYYVWSETDPGGQGGAYGGSAWHKTDHGYFYGLFSDNMPDLNYLNPAVTAQMENVVRFWLTETGADGFRIDAVKHLIEQDGKQENTPATHEWLKGFYTFYKGVDAEAYTVGEVFGAGTTLIKAYGGGQLDQIFNFELASGYLNSARGGANSGVVSALKFAETGAADGNYAVFLTNHDQERVMSVLDDKVDKAKVAAALLLTGPGTPYIYYGEEIGLTGQKPDELIRTPMQWDGAGQAGFTSSQPWEPINADYTTKNVAAQEHDSASLLNHYRALLKLRQSHSALRTGSVTLLETGHPAIYAILRSNQDETLLVLINLSQEYISGYQLALTNGEISNGGHPLESLFGDGQAENLIVKDHSFNGYLPLPELAPFVTQVFQD